MAPWAPEVVDGDGEVDLTIARVGDADVLVGSDARDAGVPVPCHVEPGALAVALQDWLDAEITRRVRALVPVHAAAVIWEGRAALFPATSGSGKTTLARALTAQGAACYSDELAFLDGEGRVHAYPRHAITRDPDGARRVQQGSGSDARRLPPVPVGWIVGLHFEPAASLRLTPMPSSEAVLLLLANTAFRLDADGCLPPALVRASAAATGLTGVRGDAVEQASALLDALSRHAPAAPADPRA